jgi:hypothetical protein
MVKGVPSEGWDSFFVLKALTTEAQRAQRKHRGNI